MGEIHAERRQPATPDHPVSLTTLADELLGEASQMSSGRAARTLTPGMHAPLKQTLVALRAGVELDEHETNGPATIYLVRGAARLTAATGSTDLAAGQWSVIPDERHGLEAGEDTVALITVAMPRAG